MSEQIVQIENLTKQFGAKIAVDDLSFDVNNGEVFAFLGSNGAGKTTTLRILLGIYVANAGKALINGQEYNEGMASLLGYLPEERGLYLNSRVLETIVYFGQLKGMSQADATKAALSYLEKVELLDKANVDIKKLSSGQQQKIQLGVAIINQPRLLILDEPTKGLDPVNRELLMDMLLDLNKSGSTVIFSTHQMEEVERIADRLVLINNGKRVLYGKTNEVKESFGTNTIQLIYEGQLPQNTSLYRINGVGNIVDLSPNENVTTDQILRYLVDQNVHIVRFEKTAPSLNEIFIQVTEGKNNE